MAYPALVNNDYVYHSSGPETESFDVGSASNRFLVVFITMNSDSASCSAMDYGGDSMTLVRRTQAQSRTTETWIIINPAANNNDVTPTSSYGGATHQHFVAWSGVDQTTGYGAEGEYDSSSTGTVRKAITTTAAESVILTEFFVNSTVTVATADNGQDFLTGSPLRGSFSSWVATYEKATAGSFDDYYTLDATGKKVILHNMEILAVASASTPSGYPVIASLMRKKNFTK